MAKGVKSNAIDAVRNLRELYAAVAAEWLATSYEIPADESDFVAAEVDRLFRLSLKNTRDIQEARKALLETPYDPPAAWLAVDPVGTFTQSRNDANNSETFTIHPGDVAGTEMVLREMQGVLFKMNHGVAAVEKKPLRVGHGVPRKEAGVLIREYLAKHRHRREPVTQAELVKAVGCSRTVVSQSAAWKAYRGVRSKVAKPGTVSFTEKVRAVTPAESTDTLDELIAEQMAQEKAEGWKPIRERSRASREHGT